MKKVGGKMYLDEHIPDERHGLKEVLLLLAKQGVEISRGFRDHRGSAATKNVYGETQLKMDKWADEVITGALSRLEQVAAVASEERPELVKLHENGDYCVVMDPLDGSSLFDVNLAVGTIFGVYGSKDPFRTGSELEAAMYILYGPLTTLTYTLGEGVHEFVLQDDGRYLLREENIVIGDRKLYAPGALRKKWFEGHRRFMEALEEEEYKLRFSGSFVADVHQIMHKGGVFSYPAYEGKVTGKLRLLFEAVPMGFMVTNAGGAVSNGAEDILGITPGRLDQRVPVYIGGKREIELARRSIRGA